MQVNLPSYHKEHTDIICLSLSRWDAEISSPAVSLAKEFAKSNRVFFIEHPYSVKDVLMGKRQAGDGRGETREGKQNPPLAGMARSAGGGPGPANKKIFPLALPYKKFRETSNFREEPLIFAIR